MGACCLPVVAAWSAAAPLGFETHQKCLEVMPCCNDVQILGQGAVHGAFAGYTGFTVGLVNTHYVYLPIPVIIQVPLPCLGHAKVEMNLCLAPV